MIPSDSPQERPEMTTSQRVVHRFRDPNRRELVAMWIWSSEYARGGLGAVEFYKRLNEARKRQIDDCVKQFEKAAP